VVPQDSENWGRNFAKRKESDAEFAANILLRTVIIDTVINSLLGRLTLDTQAPLRSNTKYHTDQPQQPRGVVAARSRFEHRLKKHVGQCELGAKHNDGTQRWSKQR